MKLLEFYARNFEEYGMIMSVRHPYYDKYYPDRNDEISKIHTTEPCMFHKYCGSNDALLAMSSRKGNQFMYVCQDCLNNYHLSWNQPDMVEYYKFKTGTDLNTEIPD